MNANLTNRVNTSKIITHTFQKKYLPLYNFSALAKRGTSLNDFHKSIAELISILKVGDQIEVMDFPNYKSNIQITEINDNSIVGNNLVMDIFPNFYDSKTNEFLFNGSDIMYDYEFDNLGITINDAISTGLIKEQRKMHDSIAEIADFSLRVTSINGNIEVTLNKELF